MANNHGGANRGASLDRVERKVDDTRELVHSLSLSIAQLVAERQRTNAEQRLNAELRAFDVRTVRRFETLERRSVALLRELQRDRQPTRA
ncbi:MAG: hypothetical protein HY791_07720 [Deltaproteobacteria bacterium]|nr:hypothetical protein [Deltaproteobacteria bacterium]